MKIVIDIPEKIYTDAKAKSISCVYIMELVNAVSNGTPLEECEYCVSIDAVIDVFNTWWAHNHESDNAIEILEDKLNALPPVTPQLKVGRWIKKKHEICFTCNQCWVTNASGVKYNYCPNCGVKMEVEE